MSTNNPAVTHHPNTDTGNQQPPTAVDPGMERKPFTVQEPGKTERMEWMTQAEADELQNKLLEEYNRKKAEELKKAEEDKKKAEGEAKVDNQNQMAKSQTPAAKPQTPAAKSQSTAATNQTKAVAVVSNERPKKKQQVVVIEVDSDDESPRQPRSTPASTVPPTPESSVSCSTSTIPPTVTSDNHVTSTTHSPGNRAAPPPHNEEELERLISGEIQSNKVSYVNIIAELCNFENLNDKAMKEANERKRKADEECERLNNRAARIKKRRQEYLQLCLKEQTMTDSDSELSIIDHTSVATPSTETLRINRGRIAPLSEAVKNIIKQ